MGSKIVFRTEFIDYDSGFGETNRYNLTDIQKELLFIHVIRRENSYQVNSNVAVLISATLVYRS